MAAGGAHHTLGHACGAGGVEDIGGVGGEHFGAGGGFGAFMGGVPFDIPAGRQFGFRHRALMDDAVIRLVRCHLDGAVEQRHVGSIPQEALTISFGLQSLIRFASSLEAKPPKTTECTAPIRVAASMAITASGIIGI